MKPFNILLSALCVLFLFSGCEKIEFDGDFEASQKMFQQFKKETDNTYLYKVVGGSWAGYSWYTTINVNQGKVVSRSYRLEGLKEGAEGPPQYEIIEEWTEEKDEIGTHSEGADPVTLDEIYSRAEKDWLKKRKGATTFFEVENNGMLSLCGYVPDGCMDDCFVGIRIDEIGKFDYKLFP